MTDKPVAANIANELARERNREAADRTLMAWIRTALSLIGFGFGIGKLAPYLDTAGLHPAHDPPHTSLIFGTSFIVVGHLGVTRFVRQRRDGLTVNHRPPEIVVIFRIEHRNRRPAAFEALL